MTAYISINPYCVLSYDNGDGPTTTHLHPGPIIDSQRDRSLRAAERYEIDRALRSARQRARTRSRAHKPTSQTRVRWKLRLERLGVGPR